MTICKHTQLTESVGLPLLATIRDLDFAAAVFSSFGVELSEGVT
jgi:hypothetical protein